jgi:RNA polymerase sigma factor (TIGR02999 family)
MSEVTRLLRRLREGERSALDELMPLVYGELRGIARAFMRGQRPGHTLQPTALVHEAFVKLFDDAQADVADRAHFLALMARVMRQVLVDHARAAAAGKRGGGEVRVTWDARIEIKDDRGPNISSCWIYTGRSMRSKMRIGTSRQRSRCTTLAA